MSLRARSLLGYGARGSYGVFVISRSRRTPSSVAPAVWARRSRAAPRCSFGCVQYACSSAAATASASSGRAVGTVRSSMPRTAYAGALPYMMRGRASPIATARMCPWPALVARCRLTHPSEFTVLPMTPVSHHVLLLEVGARVLGVAHGVRRHREIAVEQRLERREPRVQCEVAVEIDRCPPIPRRRRSPAAARESRCPAEGPCSSRPRTERRGSGRRRRRGGRSPRASCRASPASPARRNLRAGRAERRRGTRRGRRWTGGRSVE